MHQSPVGGVGIHHGVVQWLFDQDPADEGGGAEGDLAGDEVFLVILGESHSMEFGNAVGSVDFFCVWGTGNIKNNINYSSLRSCRKNGRHYNCQHQDGSMKYKKNKKIIKIEFCHFS